MYLKEIIANGFKSFADKIDIKLDDKITCIVGPNGSGKSNVVDAVRWVLGEQSVKSLRGNNNMSDIIFSGSKSRKPLNVASVELVFDNNDHYLNVPYTEISIKRKVYRTGENEYFINHKRCRLKDINNLMMDTGMGKESFNIISQGEVDKILSNSSSDRRIIFEEASGILKYKKRKEEALKRLDKTHNNLDRVNDIITELEGQLAPLRKQRDKAMEYNENKRNLDKYAVALYAYDIEDYNNRVKSLKDKKSRVDEEVLLLSNAANKSSTEYLEYNNKLDEKEAKLSALNKELLKVTEDVTRIEGEINLLKERNNNNHSKSDIDNKLRDLVNRREELIGNISKIENTINNINDDIKSENNKYNEIDGLLKKEHDKKELLTSNYSRDNQESISITHRINNLKSEIAEGGNMPNSVRRVINNKNLDGICNTIGNVIDTDDVYVKALGVATGTSRNFIITEDEDAARGAINYLKNNKLGRATFFPISVIRPRYIDKDSLSIIKSCDGFIGVMADLVKCSDRYRNIIMNQFGNIIVSDNMEHASIISKRVNRRYRVITLDGDVVNVGGSLTGGTYNSGRSVIVLRQELTNLENRLSSLKKDEEDIQSDLLDNNKKINELENELFSIDKKRNILRDKYDNKIRELNSIKGEVNNINSEYDSYHAISNNGVSSKEEELIHEYHSKVSLKENVANNIERLSDEIEKLKDNIEKLSDEERVGNSSLRNKERESKNLEIEINRCDVKLDSMLEELASEYEMTFERARESYFLDVEPEVARELVNKYKNNIKKIGMVNLDSIEEFDQVNSRYQFLDSERGDLLKAEESLLRIMDEMDSVMKEEFSSTFSAIREEFSHVFKELFMGGSADLKLTNPDDLLNSGVDIVASPPGKKLTTISLLSGGEKTLTAISLLFAILNVRSVPFCLFDEVEAALDDANVKEFGTYLNNYKDKTQFLIITHKKKTMEYAHTLYGITMQESGVSKLVSVRLDDREII